MNTKMIDQISQRTGLSVEACANMLNAGWSYVEELGGVNRWEAPIAQFTNTFFSTNS